MINLRMVEKQHSLIEIALMNLVMFKCLLKVVNTLLTSSAIVILSILIIQVGLGFELCSSTLMSDLWSILFDFSLFGDFYTASVFLISTCITLLFKLSEFYYIYLGFLF